MFNFLLWIGALSYALPHWIPLTGQTAVIYMLIFLFVGIVCVVVEREAH